MPFTFNDRQKSVAFFLLTGVFFVLVLSVLIIQGSDLIAFKQPQYTLFNDTHGFTGGTSIKYRGFNVGKIKSMTLTRDSQIRADIYFYKKYGYLLKTDSVLRVQSSLFGASSLILISSNEKESKLLKPKTLMYSSDMPEGQELLVKNAIASKSTDELTDKIKLILDDVHNLKPVLEATLLNISKTVENANSLVAGLRGTQKTRLSDEIFRTLANTNAITENVKSVSEKLKSNDNSIGAILNDPKVISGKIEKIMVNLEVVSEDMKQFSNNNLGNKKEFDKIIFLLKANLVELDSLLKAMQSVLGKGKDSKSK
ncbi:MAG: MlaD family protein [Spirochaetia bacterium]|nr:MlaD family protein [Spirochaetia bacterium]